MVRIITFYKKQLYILAVWNNHIQEQCIINGHFILQTYNASSNNFTSSGIKKGEGLIIRLDELNRLVRRFNTLNGLVRPDV